jgi:hypothetical protein
MVKYQYFLMLMLFASAAAAQCNSVWKCDTWSACTDMGYMVRTCSDLFSCPDAEGKPVEIKRCEDPDNYSVEPLAVPEVMVVEPAPNPFVGMLILTIFVIAGAIAGRMLRH